MLIEENKQSKRLELRSFEAGIEFFAYVKQYQRVVDLIKHLFLEKVNLNTSSDEISNQIDYYQKEKSFILAKMKNILVLHGKEEGEKS